MLNSTTTHPIRFLVALSVDGTVKSLTGEPDEFSAMTTAAGAQRWTSTS